MTILVQPIDHSLYWTSQNPRGSLAASIDATNNSAFTRPFPAVFQQSFIVFNFLPPVEFEVYAAGLNAEVNRSHQPFLCLSWLFSNSIVLRVRV